MSYNNRFYLNRNSRTRYAANTILSHLFEITGPVGSAIDVGCGVGTWLSVLQEKGIEDVFGVDGPWVDQHYLQIPKEKFLKQDLNNLKLPQRKFDLAISLEVAEHLSPEKASFFVEQLSYTSDIILFSAAVPFQGGNQHKNEQWPGYWCGLFKKFDFEVRDVIRPIIWDDKDIPVWYRQNSLLFVRPDKVRINLPEQVGQPLPLIHPESYLEYAKATASIKGAMVFLAKKIKRWIVNR